jgi:hypothetical protein
MFVRNFRSCYDLCVYIQLTCKYSDRNYTHLNYFHKKLSFRILNLYRVYVRDHKLARSKIIGPPHKILLEIQHTYFPNTGPRSR